MIVFVSEVIGVDIFRQGSVHYCLARVDVSEQGHPNRLKAKEYLSSLIEGMAVVVEEIATDGYGRKVVEVRSRAENINDKMISYLAGL